MEETIHGKELKIITNGVSIDGKGWSERSLRDAHYNWKFATDERALEAYGINLSQLNDVFLAAIRMINEKEESDICEDCNTQGQ